MNWWIWRIATAPQIKDSLIAIQTEWSLADLFQAHAALDAIEGVKSSTWRRMLANIESSIPSR